MTPTYGRYSEVFRDESAPFAYVDLELFDRNITAIAARAGKLPIRLASKSVRCVPLIKRALRNPAFRGVLAYSGYEAAYLASLGIDDLVVAYPITDPREIRAVSAELRRGMRITLMVDLVEHVEILGKISSAENVDFPVAIDLDLSSRWPGLHFGVHRSRISTETALRELVQVLKKYPRLRLEGLMGYEAQIAGVPDSPLTRILKNFSRPGAHRFRARAATLIREAGYTLRFVNGGGTGSLESTGNDPSVTELAAGSGLYGPTLFDGYDSFHPEAAAGFGLRVTRKPETHWAVCFSGGYVASGAPGKEKLPSPYLPEGLELSSLEGTGEVQTPLTGDAAAALKINDPVFFRHAKAGELCERFNHLVLFSGTEIVERAPTYRGEGKSFG